MEKQARVAEDVTASKAACSAVLEVCHKAKDLKQLEEHIVLLAKRRGQLKQVRAGDGLVPKPGVCVCARAPGMESGSDAVVLAWDGS